MLKYDNKEKFFINKGYINRTRIYLYPAVVMMKSYMPYMKDLKENLLCVSYQNESIVLYYDRQNTAGIKKLLTALHQNNEYISDYMQTENVYAIVVKPEINYSAFEEGCYTDIYTSEQLNKTFSKKSKTRKVLLKDPGYKQDYVDLLNEWFDTSHTIEHLESRPDGSTVEISQYDIPPCMNQEILNYEKSKRIEFGFIKPREEIVGV
jgi:hypothetical protein